MRVETTKKLILTKAEQEVIAELHNLFNNDKSLYCDGVWDILTDISNGRNELALDYGYSIKIID